MRLIKALIFLTMASFSLQSFGADLLLSVSQFNKLSITNQRNYMRQVQNAWAEFELTAGYEYALNQANPYNFNPLKYFIEPAYAQKFTPENFCMVGGVERKRVRNKRGTLVCPTYRPCKQKNQGTLLQPGNVSNSFQCGLLFNNVCVPRTPKPNQVSKRCFEHPQSQTNEAVYKNWKDRLDKYYKRNCEVPNPTNADGCNYFKQRVTALNSTAAQGGAIEEAKPVIAAPPAPKAATDPLEPPKKPEPAKATKMVESNTKWGALLKIMTKACGKHVDLNTLKSKFPQCDNTFYATTKLSNWVKEMADQTPKQATKNKLMAAGAKFFEEFNFHFNDAEFLFCRTNDPIGENIVKLNRAHAKTIESLKREGNRAQNVRDFRKSSLGSADYAGADDPILKSIRRTNFKDVRAKLGQGYTNFKSCLMNGFTKNTDKKPKCVKKSYSINCNEHQTGPCEKVKNTRALSSLVRDDLKKTQDKNLNFPFEVITRLTRVPTTRQLITTLDDKDNFTIWKPKTLYKGNAIEAREGYVNNNGMHTYTRYECEFEKTSKIDSAVPVETRTIPGSR